MASTAHEKNSPYRSEAAAVFLHYFCGAADKRRPYGGVERQFTS
jgi:hypothetical protein